MRVAEPSVLRLSPREKVKCSSRTSADTLLYLPSIKNLYRAIPHRPPSVGQVRRHLLLSRCPFKRSFLLSICIARACRWTRSQDPSVGGVPFIVSLLARDQDDPCSIASVIRRPRATPLQRPFNLKQQGESGRIFLGTRCATSRHSSSG